MEIGTYGFALLLAANCSKGRLCAIRKSKEAIELAKKKLRIKASRQQRELRPETLEHAEYVSLFTTANRFS